MTVNLFGSKNTINILTTVNQTTSETDFKDEEYPENDDHDLLLHKSMLPTMVDEGSHGIVVNVIDYDMKVNKFEPPVMLLHSFTGGVLVV